MNLHNFQHFHKHTERTLFTYPLPPKFVSCTSTVDIFESMQLDLSPPLAYSLYSCENAENNG